MTATNSEEQKHFFVSPKLADSSRRPLQVYHLSHDLRGPLNSILGFSELLLEGIEGPLTEYQEADITAIHQSAQNLLRLINTVVDLSKLEADRLKLDFAPVALDAVIQKVLAFDFGPNKPEQVELVADLPAELPSIWADRERVEQMIMNLVRFAFNKAKSGQVVIAADSAGRAVTIQVSFSQQVGLAPAQVSDLFELLVHVDPAGRSELGPGGLELPLTRALAEKHNGQVQVESHNEQGTTFVLTLPTSEAK